MTDFKGFGDWIEIFRGGKQTDSSGADHDGDELIENAVTTFDPAFHEPPLVVGHPADNAPAFGWVAGLKKEIRDGVQVLYARFKEVVPEFAALAESGIYKKRSASFYPDGRLRHVGFLGAAPPAVKGLADIAFGDTQDAATFDYRNNFEERDMTTQTYTETQLQSALSDQEARIRAQMKADIESAVAAERERVAAEFAEQQRQASEKAMRKGISDRLTALIAGGKIPPALAAGIPQFAESLPIADVIEFSEGKKESPAAWFAGYMEKLFGSDPFASLFAEQVTKKDAGKSGKTQEEEDDELGKSIAEKVNPKKGFPEKGGK